MELNYHFNTETFRAAWEEWKEHKKTEIRKPIRTQRGEQCQLTYLYNLSNKNETVALAIIERAMGTGTQGLWPLPWNHPLNQKQTSQHPQSKVSQNLQNSKQADALIDKLYGSGTN